MPVIEEFFRYDHWANEKWRQALIQQGKPPAEWAVLTHIASAQEIWIARIEGHSPTSLPVVEPTAEAFDQLHNRWIKALTEIPLDQAISYQNTVGTSFSHRLGEIALQVANHGTYHRGELRGLFRARGDDSFPETDYMYFLRR